MKFDLLKLENHQLRCDLKGIESVSQTQLVTDL